MKRPRPQLQELPANDGMSELRKEIQCINSSGKCHEERATALRALMTAKWEKKDLSVASALLATKKIRLPENEIIAPNLEALPVELIENIAKEMNCQEFGAFRLLCRAVQEKSLHLFNKYFFSKLKCSLQWESLRRIVLIQGHQVFGASIKALEIHVPDQSTFTPSNPTTSSRPGRIRHPHEPEETPLNGNTNQIRAIGMMLDRIFDRLPEIQHLSLIRPSAIASRDRRPLAPDAIAIIFKVISTSITRIHSLTIGGDRKANKWNWVEDRLTPNSLNTQIQDCATELTWRFQHLQCLELAWDPASRFQHGDITSRQDLKADFPNALLRAVPNVETLVLRHVNNYEGPNQLSYFQTVLSKARHVDIYISPNRYENFDPPVAVDWLSEIEDFVVGCVVNVKVLGLFDLPNFTQKRVTLLQNRIQERFAEIEKVVVTNAQVDDVETDED